MADFDNTNRGAIWKNDKKETEKHPDYKGEANVNGTEYWVSAWSKSPQAKTNQPVLSFAFTAKDGAPAPTPAPKREDDLPF